jgi:hypothetical protein
MLPVEAPAGQAVAMDELFDDIGTERLRYSARCCALNGAWVQFEAHVARTHDDSGWLVVDQAGACPDCSPVPVAALQLPGFAPGEDITAERPLTLRGRLSYGFAVDGQGNASFLRLEDAQVVHTDTPLQEARS